MPSPTFNESPNRIYEIEEKRKRQRKLTDTQIERLHRLKLLIEKEAKIRRKVDDVNKCVDRRKSTSALLGNSGGYYLGITHVQPYRSSQSPPFLEVDYAVSNASDSRSGSYASDMKRCRSWEGVNQSLPNHWLEEDELRMKLDRTSIDAMRLRKITLAHTRPLSSSTTCLLDKHPPQAGTSAFTANRSASPQSGAYNVPQESKHDVDDTRPRHLSGQHDGAITSNHEGESLLRRKISSVTSPAAVRLRNAQEKAAQRKRSLRMLDEDLFRVQDVLARARRFSQEDLLNDSSDARHPVPGQLAPERSASEDNLSESRSQGVRRAAPEHQNKKERPTSTYY